MTAPLVALSMIAITGSGGTVFPLRYRRTATRLRPMSRPKSSSVLRVSFMYSASFMRPNVHHMHVPAQAPTCMPSDTKLKTVGVCVLMPPIKKPERSRTRHYIRAWREHRNLTQQQLADRMQTTRETVSRVENGLVPYNQDFIEVCANALNCSPSDLLDHNPQLENAVSELHRIVMEASTDDQRRILAVAKTLLQNNG